MKPLERSIVAVTLILILVFQAINFGMTLDYERKLADAQRQTDKAIQLQSNLARRVFSMDREKTNQIIADRLKAINTP